MTYIEKVDYDQLKVEFYNEDNPATVEHIAAMRLVYHAVKRDSGITLDILIDNEQVPDHEIALLYYKGFLIGAWDGTYNPEDKLWAIYRIGIQGFYRGKGIFQNYIYPLFEERYGSNGDEYYLDTVRNPVLLDLCEKLHIQRTIL